MIFIKNRQRKIKFSSELFNKKTQIILSNLGYIDFDISILLTTNASIKKLNCNFRNKNVATDILAFPFYSNLKAGERIVILTDDVDLKNLGDIVISLEFVLKNKKKLKGNFEARMNLLLVHGILHLLGYDHIEDADYKIMAKEEKRLLKLIEV